MITRQYSRSVKNDFARVNKPDINISKSLVLSPSDIQVPDHDKQSNDVLVLHTHVVNAS